MVQEELLNYQADGLAMRSRLFLEHAPAPRAGILVFPEAFGLDDLAIARAKRLASLGYVVLACDLHGEGEIIADLQEAMTELQPLFDEPTRTRARASAALMALAARPEVDPERIAAIGFCFPISLELARSGAGLRAAVGFHTSLTTKRPTSTAGGMKARILACVGADDPFIPPDHRAEFEMEMRGAGVEWELQVYGRTVHSFTNPDAAKRNMPDAIRFNAESAARAWNSALDLFERTLK
jgi:dienelactone hydrolase